MENPLNVLQHYTTVFTGLLLLMNLCLLVSLRVALRWARRASEADHSEAGVARWKSARQTIGLMIGVVIVMNCLSVFANQRLRRSVDEVTTTFSSDTGGSVAQSRP